MGRCCQFATAACSIFHCNCPRPRRQRHSSIAVVPVAIALFAILWDFRSSGGRARGALVVIICTVIFRIRTILQANVVVIGLSAAAHAAFDLNSTFDISPII